MGLINDLYMRSLVISLVCLLVISVLIEHSRLFRASFLVLIWNSQVRRRSKVKSMYLTEWNEGIGMLLRETFGQGGRWRVNVVWMDFDWLIWTCHFSYQTDIRSRWFWKFKKSNVWAFMYWYNCLIIRKFSYRYCWWGKLVCCIYIIQYWRKNATLRDSCTNFFNIWKGRAKLDLEMTIRKIRFNK